MKPYTPELINELTRIVVTTRNDNPSVAEYDELVPPAWKRCQDISAAALGGPPAPDQLRVVFESVVLMLLVKRVPESEIRERIDEAFARCERGAYPVDRAAVESGGWTAARRRLPATTL